MGKVTFEQRAENVLAGKEHARYEELNKGVACRYKVAAVGSRKGLIKFIL